jgi:acyl-CoA thioester hydrolase
MTESEGFGRFEGKVHVLPIRIYYEDTDLSGIVYHANYLRYMERGRSEFFRCAGIVKLAVLDDEQPWAWTLRKVTLEYLMPARVDDLIEVHTAAGGTSAPQARAMICAASRNPRTSPPLAASGTMPKLDSTE